MMSAALLPPSGSASALALARAGFVPLSAGRHQRGELALVIGPQWCVLEAPVPPTTPAPERERRAPMRLVEEEPVRAASECGAPTNPVGLWRRVGAGVDARCLLELPRIAWDQAVVAEVAFDGQPTVLDELLQWALDSLSASMSPEWQPPPRDDVESWIPPEQLAVLAGSSFVQGELICQPGRFGIRFPLVPILPPELPESRDAWLRALLEEGQDRWHLVRLGVFADNEDQSSVIAEVDLTGVPHDLAQTLFVISLESLRGVVQWLGETTDWLADATVASELLAVCPDQQP
jgi:hypothetical protein